MSEPYPNEPGAETGDAAGPEPEPYYLVPEKEEEYVDPYAYVFDVAETNISHPAAVKDNQTLDAAPLNQEVSLYDSGTRELAIALWPYRSQNPTAADVEKTNVYALTDAHILAYCFAAAFGLVSMFFAYHYFAGATYIVAPLLLLCPVGAAYLVFRDPAYVRIYKWGIKIEWMFAGRVVQEHQIYWKFLRRIVLTEPEPNFLGDTKPRIRFETNDGITFDLKLENIANREDWKLLAKAAKEWGAESNILVDPRILNSFGNDDKTASYTELWLEALTAAPERTRLQPLAEGTVLHNGAFTILRQIASGGQGTAYVASPDYPPGAEIVLKEYILPVYVDVKAKRYAIDQFTAEASTLKSLNHPNIVKLIDYFVEDHRAYLVEEYIRGNSLRTAVELHGACPQDRVIALAGVMTDILCYLHGCSPPIVHRDFTPDNLLLDSDGTLKLIDFTVAQRGESGTVNTAVGKQSYLPPEQFRGRATTQSDIFAFGATLYCLLTGADPEPLTQLRVSTARPDVDPLLDELIFKCTALDLGERYRRIEEVKGELSIIKRQIQRTQPGNG